MHVGIGVRRERVSESGENSIHGKAEKKYSRDMQNMITASDYACYLSYRWMNYNVKLIDYRLTSTFECERRSSEKSNDAFNLCKAAFVHMRTDLESTDNFQPERVQLCLIRF